MDITLNKPFSSIEFKLHYHAFPMHICFLFISSLFLISETFPNPGAAWQYPHDAALPILCSFRVIPVGHSEEPYVNS